jgi:LuxR family maltose regulon positive regulatory protein
MPNIPSIRITVPRGAAALITRKSLLDTVLGRPKKLTYIHAGAGYGKTTLLSQIAGGAENAVWLSLDGEDDIFTFVNELCEAIKQTFSEYDFAPSEYLPFAEKENFISMLAGALICSMENIPKDFVLALDDVHTTENAEIKKLLSSLVKYAPKNARLFLGSREAPWEELLSLRIKGDILELTQKELAFTREEAAGILGFDDSSLYGTTEGWPLAVSSFKMLLESGIAVRDIPSYGVEALYDYLFRECIGSLNAGLVDFLKRSACFVELEAQMLDDVLNIKNARLMLESLASRNIFTVRTGGGFYRYHTLFRNSLLKDGDASGTLLLFHKAARYYFEKKQFSMAARYAMEARDCGFLDEIILACYRDYIKAGSYNELRIWFRALDDGCAELNPRLLVAKGAYLSVIGNFVEAEACLTAAIPLLDQNDKELYLEAMVHKARMLRNFISFEESNKLLDELIARLDDPTSESSYSVVIEKIYNLCWNSQISESYALCRRMIEACAGAGSLKVKAWYERYLSVIHFVAGRMKDSVYFYEKSAEIPENERLYLDMHSIDIFVAKAYQMLGQRDKAVSLVTTELSKLRNAGRYEELWLGYLFAAEISYQNTSIDRMNGGSPTFETTARYFTLANEFAPLYRKTQFQMDLTKLLYNIYSLLFTDGDKEKIISEIYEDIPKVGDYFKTIALGRLYNYFGFVSDFERAASCAKQSIEIGERADTMMVATMAYGLLTRIALEGGANQEAARLTKRFLSLCYETGSYEYFKMRKAYDPVLVYAYSNGIEPEITRQLMDFASLVPKKVYIDALGGLGVFRDKERLVPLKLQRRKERELLAFLLNTGERGATKEQMYNAIWWDSESENVKNVIAVNLTNIKSELGRAGIEKSVICRDNRYYICRDEIEYDIDLFENAYDDFKQNATPIQAKKLLSLYRGDYLVGFEALWAEPMRIKYRDIYEEAKRAAGQISGTP